MFLKILHIPITDLTLLGSTVALTIGFAAKNTLNNTTSGLVILLERAIEVGDVIQIGEKIGTVKSIGIRSTIIHNTENLDIILPNSSYLANLKKLKLFLPCHNNRLIWIFQSLWILVLSVMIIISNFIINYLNFT